MGLEWVTQGAGSLFACPPCLTNQPLFSRIKTPPRSARIAACSKVAVDYGAGADARVCVGVWVWVCVMRARVCMWGGKAQRKRLL